MNDDGYSVEKTITKGVKRVKGKNEKVFARGDIYYCDLRADAGSVQRGYRPVVIIQNDTGNRFSPTLIVTPITTIIKKEQLPTHVIMGKGFGLRNESMVLLEQIHTVDKLAQIGDYVGSISKAVMTKIDNALRLSVGL